MGLVMSNRLACKTNAASQTSQNFYPDKRLRPKNSLFSHNSSRTSWRTFRTKIYFTSVKLFLRKFIWSYCCSCRWGETISLNCGHQRAYCSSSRWYMSMESHDGMTLTGENRRSLRKADPSAALSTTNLTWTDPGANPGLRGKRNGHIN
jgi:hypothetical protein